MISFIFILLLSVPHGGLSIINKLHGGVRNLSVEYFLSENDWDLQLNVSWLPPVDDNKKPSYYRYLKN